MSTPDTFSCPSCDSTYKRQGLPAGKKVKCPKCQAIITVPGEEPLAEAPEPEPEPARTRTAGAARRGRSAARGGAAARGGRAARAARREPIEKSRTPLLIGAGVIVVVAVVAIFLARRGGGEPQPGTPGTTGGAASTSGQGSGQTPAQPPEPAKPKTAREMFDMHLAEAAKDGDKSARTEHLVEAIAILDRNQWPDAGPRQDLLEKILAIDPDHAQTRRELGFIRYTGDWDEYKDKWLTKDKYAEVVKEWQRLVEERKQKDAEEQEKLRWTRDDFAKKARRVRDHFIKDTEKVPDMKLRFFLDVPEIERPYLLMVEDVAVPEPEATAKTLGPGLSALRDAFFKAYGTEILPDWDKDNYVVPVMVFKDAKSYERYRDNGHQFFPSTGLAAAFYVSTGPQGIDDICRGTLYVWQGASESQFYHEVFHEATHQLMHNAARGANLPPTPWLQEGIAELWGSYEGNQYSGFKFRRFLAGRFPSISDAANAYYQWKAAGKQGPRSFLTPKEVISIDQDRFGRAKAMLDGRMRGSPAEMSEARVIVGNVYAMGWAFIFWSHYGEGGKYIEPFKKVLAIELRYRFSPERLAEFYEITSDEQWDEISDKFFLFCRRTMQRWALGAPLPDLPQ